MNGYLLRIVPRYAHRFTTPAILAETFNLLGPFIRSLSRPVADALRSRIREELAIIEERHIPAKEIARDDALLRYGFTDLAVAKLAGDEMLVLTTDAPLARLLELRGLPCVNYNHIRFAF